MTPTRKPSPYDRPPQPSHAPAILGLLADGVPRRKPAIVEALAGRHDRQDVVHELIRLSVTGQMEETGGRYALGAAVAALP